MAQNNTKICWACTTLLSVENDLIFLSGPFSTTTKPPDNLRTPVETLHKSLHNRASVGDFDPQWLLPFYIFSDIYLHVRNQYRSSLTSGYIAEKKILQNDWFIMTQNWKKYSELSFNPYKSPNLSLQAIFTRQAWPHTKNAYLHAKNYNVHWLLLEWLLLKESSDLIG